jgi:DUF1009 family protein
MRTVVMAGMGLLPYEAVKNLQSRGEEVIVIAFTEQSATDFSKITDNVFVFSIGQVGKILKFLRELHVDSLVFAGKINKAILEQNLKLDFKAMWMLAKLKDRQENTIMLAIIKEIEKLGVMVRSQLDALSHLVIKKGVYTKNMPTDKQLEDVRFGYTKAKGIAALDIGQTIVVKNKTVLAVESFEGTNNAIVRGGSFAKGFSFVKVARPEQDYRFDLPVVGMETLNALIESGGAVFAVEADSTLILDIPACIEMAEKNNVVLMAYTP